MSFNFVANYPSTQPWSISTANQIVLSSVAVQNGDVVVVAVGVEGANSGVWGTTATVTMNGVTFTKLENSSVLSTDAKAAFFYKQVTFTGTYSITIDRISTGSAWWGGLADVIRGSDGIGATNSSNNAGDPAQISLLTTRANSAIECFFVDWQALDGASRTWATISPSGTGTELLYQRNSGRATAYMNRWNDVGAIGTKTVGLSSDIAGGTVHSSMVVLEVLLASSGESHSATTTIGLGLGVSGTAAKRGVSASSIGLGFATSGSDTKAGTSSSSIPLSVSASGTSSKAVSSSAAIGLDISADGDESKASSSSSLLGLGLATSALDTKQGLANTSLNLTIDLSATAVKMGVTYAELLLALGIEAFVGDAPEDYEVSASLGIALSVSTDVHKDANASVPITLRVDFDGDVAKTVHATVSLQLLLSLATNALKSGHSETALALMIALSGVANNPDNDRDIVFTLTTLQGYNLILSNLEGYSLSYTDLHGNDLRLSTIRKE